MHTASDDDGGRKMINVAVTEVKGMIHISVYGHSGVRGESLPCAGASTLFAALASSVEPRSEYICESGYGDIVYPATDFNKTLTYMFKKGMTLLKNTYPDEFSVR